MPRSHRTFRNSSHDLPEARSQPRPRRRIESAALALLGLLVVGAPQLLGGTYASGMVAIACCALSALALSLHASRHRTLPALPALGVVALLALLFTAIQALPWPCSWVEALSPESALKLRAALVLLGDGAPATCTLSHDPGGTRAELVKGVAIVSAFFAAWLLSARGHEHAVLRLVAGSSVAMALVALAHAVLQLERVFGVYEPLYTGKGLVLAPLLNPNNLGGFVALGVPLWIELAYRQQRLEARLWAYAAVALSATTVLLTLSRGAIAVLAASSAAMCFVLWTRSGGRYASYGPRQRVLALGAGSAAAAGIGLGAYVLQQRLWSLAGEDLSKLELLGRGFALSTKHPWLGVGRGAFESAFAAEHGGAARFAYAENLLAQWSSEWGWPVTLLIAAGCVHALLSAALASRSLQRSAAVVGLCALAIQNLADLSLELVGVSVVAAATLGAITTTRRTRTKLGRWRERLPARPAATLAGALGIVALIWLAPTLGSDQALALEMRLRESFAARDRAGFEATLHRAARMHPGDPVFAVLASGERVARNDKSAGRWLNRAMTLAPGWQTPHVLASEWLWRNGRTQQAMLELRRAAEIDPWPIRDKLCAAAKLGLEPALAMLPRGKNRAHALELVASCLPHDHATSAALDELAIREGQRCPIAYRRHAWRRARTGRIDDAMKVLDELAHRYPEHVGTWYTRAQLLLDAGRPEQAARAAATGLARCADQDKEALLVVRAHALGRLGDEAGLEATLASLRAHSADESTGLARAYAIEGHVRSERGDLRQAARAYRSAFDITGDIESLWRMLEVSRRAGDLDSVGWAKTRLCALRPDHPRYCPAARPSQVLPGSQPGQ